MTRVAIAIITWNNADDAIECAMGLLQQSMIDDMKILFVDNDSSKETVLKLESFMQLHSSSPFELLKTGHNGGTAGGFNAAIHWARNNDIAYIGALNADAVVASSLWCRSLVRTLDTHKDVGIVTGTVLHRDGKTIDSTGDFYTTWGIPGPRGRDKPASHTPQEPGYIFGATGGCFVARTAMYKDVGLYDEKFFMYYEDVDLSFRAQLAGYKVWYTPEAIVYHKRGASADTIPGLATYNTFKNLPLLFIKNVPLKLWWHIYPRFLVAYLLILGSAIKKGRGLAALKGFLMSWRYTPHAFRERSTAQKRRKVSADYINEIIVHGVPPDQTGLYKFSRLFRRSNNTPSN